ncbi:2-hydroxyacid dehydrogenase [Aurantiacibacter marinus]|uniref:2-hydroxyacid dehydrogenase n=1 Tax=Aurantiacibacter marinus TaxID=874156 RepID=A0A0H0XKR2_9SPHN|nr:2-hydroxyacid dehydrogenase [Aurantiacibacter marinus]KLI62919.1 2-hydroxyacid dehydrogenase [Aurantiacibacter marinus]
MKVVIFSAEAHDRAFLPRANADDAHELTFLDARLDNSTAVLASGYDAVCAFVCDELSEEVLVQLHRQGIRLVALRCAGFNNVDLQTASRLGITVARVPAYSPHAVAEHTFALLLMLTRKLHRAHNRVREGNFELEGLLGFNLHEKVLGIVGTGAIGNVVARIGTGFGCKVIACDPAPNDECRAMGVRYVDWSTLCREVDILTLHCPLTADTKHLLSAREIAAMKQAVTIINTSRGAVLDTRAVIDGLKSGKIGALGLDVYEEEDGLFFHDLSEQVIQDDMFARLITFPNVVITGHQGFFTQEALAAIAETTIANLSSFADTGHAVHAL